MPSDLNRKIAEKLGWTKIAQLGEGLMCGTNPDRPASHGAEQVPAYDTDPAAMLELLEMMRHDERGQELIGEAIEDFIELGLTLPAAMAPRGLAWLESKEPGDEP